MTTSLVLDLVLVVIMLANTLRGWRNGIVASGLGLLGFLLGAGLALWGAPALLARLDGPAGTEPARALLLLLAVLAGAGLGQAILGGVGHRLRVANRVDGVRLLDSSLGVVATAVVTALVIGVLGAGVKPVLPKSWASAMNGSHVLGAIERALPDQSQRWAAKLTDSLDAAGLPHAFSGLSPEPVLPADAPEASAAQTAAVRRAAASIVKVEADANACSREQSGSGWVVAPQRIVTNAHVVAGSGAVTVRVRGTGPALDARVVAFNADLDLAILDVAALSAPALARTRAVRRDDSAVVAGFPLGGPYRAQAARVRGAIQASGEDIYGRKAVTRQVYALYATAQQGNSGGPLLTTEGRVAGTIFARSLVDARTTYALTDAATDTMLDHAATYSTAVRTGACAG